MIDNKKIDIIRSSHPFKIIDIVIILIVLILSITFSVLSYTKKGEKVCVIDNGYQTIYDLTKDQDIKLSHLTIHISNGYVYVTDSDCNDHICEKSGKINKINQMIVCLPNNIIIKIIGEDNYQAETGQNR